MPIKELPKSVSSKIAAGEVVERPASVVKELIENSIDANAGEINIGIIEAGRTLIEVEDNGDGIPPEEAEIALKRYATSKISMIEDLERIQSLGFRGEALASIAAVSRFTLETRFRNESQGVVLRLESGDVVARSGLGRNQGTRIKVENLFFNVPARQKFLKKDITEKRLISELVAWYALYYSHIRFSLLIDGKKTFATFGRGDQREILSQIYDFETARQLLEIYYQDSKIRLRGFTSPTGLTRSNRKEIIHFVNGRLVSDPALTSAVLRAYQGFLMVGRFPVTSLFFTIDPEEIDVNVHPTKAEIRFRDQGKAFSAVHSALRKTISAFSPVPALSPDIWSSISRSEKTPEPAWEFAQQVFSHDLLMSKEHQEPEKSRSMRDKVPLLRPIGQLGRTYLVAEGPDGMYLIDQHAAHERVLYEKMADSDQGSSASQMLLEPQVLQLPHGLMEAYASEQVTLKNLGFIAELFGPDSLKIFALPSVIKHLDAGEALRSALEIDEEDRSLVELNRDERIISRICKRAAVKGGQVLSFEEQERLVRDLENCESPRTCPHGRPTMIHLSVDSLARQFGRLGSR
jgi:DNA mismatch repair protein MutL